MHTHEEAIDLLRKTIDFSIPSLKQWNEPLYTILKTHENFAELATAFITLCGYLQQQPACDKDSEEEKKIKAIIAEMTKNPNPSLLINAILLLKTSTFMLTDAVFPQLTYTLKTHKNPMAFAHAFMYFSNSFILNNEKNVHYKVNLKKIAIIAEQWFGESLLLPYFQQLSSSVFSQDLFEHLYNLSQEQPIPEINQFSVACALCLLCPHNKELFQSIQIIEPFIFERIKQLKTIPKELFQLPMILYTAQRPYVVAQALVATSKATLFAEKTYEGAKNLSFLLSNANLWFDDSELLELFQKLPRYRWSPKLLESLVLASNYVSSNESTSFLVRCILSSTAYEAKKSENNQAAYESFIAKEKVKQHTKSRRYSFYNDINMPGIDRSSKCIDTPLPNKNKMRCQSEDNAAQEEMMSVERAHSIG